MISRTSRLLTLGLGGLAATLLLPSFALAQYGRPQRGPTPAIGENYRLEISTTWWKPEVVGSVTSDRLNVIGSQVDLVSDLGFEPGKFKDLKVALRPARKHRLRFEYLPLQYQASGVLTREITFAGKVFPVSLPVDSSLGWKVWRFGYEWDVVYKSRGFVGVLLEARKTELSAELTSLVAAGSTLGEAPLPSIGIVARAYPLPDLALNLEVGGMKLPPIDDRYEGNYSDIDVSATVNITNNLGLSVGWRQIDTSLRIDRDLGNLKFKGVWFGGAIRF